MTSGIIGQTSVDMRKDPSQAVIAQIMLQCLLGLLQYLRHLFQPPYSKPISMTFRVARLRSR